MHGLHSRRVITRLSNMLCKQEFPDTHFERHKINKIGRINNVSSKANATFCTKKKESCARIDDKLKSFLKDDTRDDEIRNLLILQLFVNIE